MSSKEVQEKQLGKLYESLNSDKTAIIPEDKAKKLITSSGVTPEKMADYLTTMASDLMPRKIRDEGRESTDVEVYAIPANYFGITDNMVNFNLNEGFFAPDNHAKGEEVKILGKEIKVFNGYSTSDMGTFLCLYLFQHGRKTVDELVKELGSYDKTFLNLLVNRLQDDDFIRVHTEEDGTETLEIFTKKEREDLSERRLKALGQKDN